MDTQICSKCGKKMIKISTGITLTSYPPQYPQKYWCGCGHEEPAETVMGTTPEQENMNLWKDANW